MKNNYTLFVIGIVVYFALSIMFQLGSDTDGYKLLYLFKEKLMAFVLCGYLYRKMNNSVCIFAIGSLWFYQVIFLLSRILIYIHTLNSLKYALLLSEPIVVIPLCVVAGISLVLINVLTKK